MPEVQDDIRTDKINESYMAIDKTFVDEVNKNKLSYIEIEIILLYLKKKIEAEEWRGFAKFESEEQSKKNDMYS